MIVCLCKVVTDQDIQRTIADGAHSVEQVSNRCGAGTGCGACRGYIDEMIERSQASCRGASCSDCPRKQAAREAA